MTIDQVVSLLLTGMVVLIVVIFARALFRTGKMVMPVKTGFRYTNNVTFYVMLFSCGFILVSMFTTGYEMTWSSVLTLISLILMAAVFMLQNIVKKGFYENAVISNQFPPIFYTQLKNIEVVRHTASTTRIYFNPRATRRSANAGQFVELDTEQSKAARKLISTAMRRQTLKPDSPEDSLEPDEPAEAKPAAAKPAAPQRKTRKSKKHSRKH